MQWSPLPSVDRFFQDMTLSLGLVVLVVDVAGSPHDARVTAGTAACGPGAAGADVGRGRAGAGAAGGIAVALPIVCSRLSRQDFPSRRRWGVYLLLSAGAAPHGTAGRSRLMSRGTP